jgi:Wiskott-Aldrich syndrome protein
MIQILDLQKFGVLFSQELYVGCVYNCSEALFHSFEIDSGFVGFSFVDAAEAKDFSQKVLQAIPKHDPNVPTAPMQRNNAFKSFVSKASMATGIKLPGVQQGMNIGLPTGFVHKQHIGYDPSKGFECSDIPEQWKAMFRSVGIKKADLQSPEKAAVIYEALQNELGEDFLEKDPPVIPTATGGKGGGKKAPPVPKRGGGGPPSSAPAAPPMDDIPDCPSAPPPPGPPPPAPSPPSGPAAIGKVGGAAANGRGNLLADINAGGFKLKKVGDGDEKGSASDGPVRPASKSQAQLSPDKTASIMGALSQAMEGRFKALQSEEAEEPDDWSD